MIKKEDFTRVNAPVVGTYTNSVSPNSGLRFSYMRAGPISFYWYDDNLEAFLMGNKFIQVSNWEGKSYQRAALQRRHIETVIYGQAEEDKGELLNEVEKRKLKAAANKSSFVTPQNLPYVIKHALTSGELTKEVVKEAVDTFNKHRREGRMNYDGDFIK